MSFPPRYGAPPLPPAPYAPPFGQVPVVPLMPRTGHYLMPNYISLATCGAQSVDRSSTMQFMPDYMKRQEVLMERPPVTTVFVGNINDRVSNDMIKAMLTKCGNIINWKRVQGPSGKYQAFGFCEYDHPDSTLRALRLLHDWPLGEKRLVLKCDEKNKKMLIDFINKRRELYGKPPLKLEEGDQMPADDEMKREDEQFRKALVNLVEEMGGNLVCGDAINGAFSSKAPTLIGKGGNLDIESLDRDRKEYIAKEIIQFREAHKDEKETKGKDGEDGHSPSGGGERLGKRHRGDDLSPGRSPSVASVESRHDSKRAKRREPIKDTRTNDTDENDSYERRRIERKIREKEAAYQERLQKWEQRERRKVREFEKKREVEASKSKEEAKEVKLLKEFLEDYDDDRMDASFYKGRALSTRQMDYVAELERDNRDREKEKQEYEKLKKELAREKANQEKAPGWKPVFVKGAKENATKADLPPAPAVVESTAKPAPVPPSPKKVSPPKMSADNGSSSNKSIGFGGLKLGATAPTTSTVQSGSATVSTLFAEEEVHEAVPSRKLVPLEYTEEEKQTLVEAQFENQNLSVADKRRIIKNLIENIPTNKEELFAQEIQWELVDKYIYEKRLRPWIMKKVIEYIGEEELSLVDFIIQKVEEKSAPRDIIKDVSMVLDEEATVFVVKLWRLLIYEIEAKKMGLSKIDA